MVFNLKIENRAVDLPEGFELSFSENSNIFSTPERIQTAVTNTITLPFTLTNRDIFEFEPSNLRAQGYKVDPRATGRLLNYKILNKDKSIKCEIQI